MLGKHAREKKSCDEISEKIFQFVKSRPGQKTCWSHKKIVQNFITIKSAPNRLKTVKTYRENIKQIID